MSVALVNPQQGEVVLPAISNAFSVPPIQRSYTEGRAHEIYQSADPQLTNEGSVLTLEIPPASSQQVYDLTQSHIQLEYYWAYADGKSVPSNDDAANPLMKGHNMSSQRAVRGAEKFKGVGGAAAGTSRDLNYTVLGAALSNDLSDLGKSNNGAGTPVETARVLAGRLEEQAFKQQAKSSLYHGDTASPAKGLMFTQPASFGPNVAIGVVAGADMIAPGIIDNPRGEGLDDLDLANAPVGSAPEIRYNKQIFKYDNGNGDDMLLTIDPGGWSKGGTVAAANSGGTFHLGSFAEIPDGLWDPCAGEAGDTVNGYNLNPRTWRHQYATGAGNYSEGQIKSAARGSSGDIVNGHYVRINRVRASANRNDGTAYTLTDAEYMDQVDPVLRGWNSDLTLTSANRPAKEEIIGRYICIKGEVMRIVTFPFMQGVASQQLVYQVVRGCLGTKTPNKWQAELEEYPIGTGVTVLERAEVAAHETAISTKVGWTDRIFKEMTFEMNSVSVQESDPRYGVAKQVRTLMERPGRQLKTHAAMTGWDLEDLEEPVYDGLVTGGNSALRLSDIGRYQPDESWHRRRRNFLESTTSGSVAAGEFLASGRNGPLRKLIFKPALWDDVALLPDGVTQVLRFTRGLDKELLCGPLAFDDIPAGFGAKHQCQPNNLTIGVGAGPAYGTSTLAKSGLLPTLRIVSCNAYMKKNVLTAVTNAAFLKHLAGDDLKLNSPLRRHYTKRIDAGNSSVSANQVLPGPKPELVVVYLQSEAQQLGSDNDGSQFGVASPFKPEMTSLMATEAAGQMCQVKSISISTAGQQYPFRRIELSRTNTTGKKIISGSGVTSDEASLADGRSPSGYEELYRMYVQACPDEDDPSMTYSQFCQNPLYVFETTADMSKSFPDAIVMQTSVSVDIELYQKLSVPTILGVYTTSQQAITIDAQRRVIVG